MKIMMAICICTVRGNCDCNIIFWIYSKIYVKIGLISVFLIDMVNKGDINMVKIWKLTTALLAGIFLFSMAGCSDSSQQQNLASSEKEVSGGVDSGDNALEDGEESFPKKLPEFSTKDLGGNEVTNEIFKDKELTVVNVWGTFCSPCIEEMPELGKWAEGMPDNVQIIGLVVDVENEEDGNFELANNIVKTSGAGFVQIIANEDFNILLDEITGVPTTFFVDSEGNIVGTPILGADVGAYKSFVEEYINGKKK